MVLHKFHVVVSDSLGKVVAAYSATGFTEEEAIRKIAEKFDGQSFGGKTSSHKYPLTFSTEELSE